MFARKSFFPNAFRSHCLFNNKLSPKSGPICGAKFMSDKVKGAGTPGCDLPSLKSSSDPASDPQKFTDKVIPYSDEVENKVNAQIRNEFQASHTYLAMAQYFASKNYFVGFAGFSNLCIALTVWRWISFFSILFGDVERRTQPCAQFDRLPEYAGRFCGTRCTEKARNSIQRHFLIIEFCIEFGKKQHNRIHAITWDRSSAQWFDNNGFNCVNLSEGAGGIGTTHSKHA